MAFPEEQLRKEALLCLIYFRGHKGGTDYLLTPKEAYTLLADYFNLSEFDRTRPVSDTDSRSNWMIHVEGTRERLAQKGFILRPPPNGIWKLSQEGIEEAKRLSYRYTELGLVESLDVKTPSATDLSDPPETTRTLCKTYRVLRDTQLSRRIKLLHENSCQLCGHTIQLPNGQRYSEAHHIKPLGIPHNGPDVAENIICVCPNHHVELDYGAIKLDKDMFRNHAEHTIGVEYIQYHNEVVLKRY
jgi:HNH endonuclease